VRLRLKVRRLTKHIVIADNLQGLSNLEGLGNTLDKAALVPCITTINQKALPIKKELSYKPKP